MLVDGPFPEHPLSLGMGADHFMYRKKESFLFKELERFLCLKYVFLFQVVFFNFGSLLYTSFPSYRYKGERGWTYFRFAPLFEIQENDACGRDSALKIFQGQGVRAVSRFVRALRRVSGIRKKSRQYVEKWHCPKKLSVTSLRI